MNIIDIYHHHYAIHLSTPHKILRGWGRGHNPKKQGSRGHYLKALQRLSGKLTTIDGTKFILEIISFDSESQVQDLTGDEMQLYSFNRMQFSYENLQTLRKPRRTGQIARARSLDHFNFQQLNTQELKLLLDIPKKPSEGLLQQAVMKQELLIHKKLFDPFKYFGCLNFLSVEESHRFHRTRLEAMFSSGTTQQKVSLKQTAERKTSKVGEVSPASRFKESVVSSEKSRRTVGRSPKSFVKENKQNYQRLNINNMQKVRVKLKLGKR